MPKLRIYCDEDVNMAIVEGLRKQGLNVQSTKEAENLGALDNKQLEYASSKGACIFTHDDDFLKLADKWSKQGRKHQGIIYISQQKAKVSYCIRKVKAIYENLTQKDMENHIEFL